MFNQYMSQILLIYFIIHEFFSHKIIIINPNLVYLLVWDEYFYA